MEIQLKDKARSLALVDGEVALVAMKHNQLVIARRAKEVIDSKGCESCREAKACKQI